MKTSKIILLTLPWLPAIALFLLLRARVDYDRRELLNDAVLNRNVARALDIKSLGVESSANVELRLRILTGDLKGIETYLRRGASINFCDYNWPTPLSLAATIGSVPAAKCLLDHGADIDEIDDSPNHEPTALITAADAQQAEVVKLLIERGADLNLLTRDGNTALDTARLVDANGSYLATIKCIHYLTEAGAKARHTKPLAQEREDVRP